MTTGTEHNPASITAAAPAADHAAAPRADRLDELAQIIRAYNQVTENLQQSHDALREQVVRLQRELASTDAQLQRSKRLAALGEMAAGIAHEIRNPLAAIHLYASMIVDDLAAVPGLRQTHETAGKIASAVRGLNAIVCDVLAFSRELSPRPHPLRVGELLDRVLEAHRPAIDSQTVRVVRRGDGGVFIHADAQLMHQAVLNLVRNAVDAMAERTPHAGPHTLTLTAQRDEQGVTISVRDTGPGIPPEAVERIFNPFFTTRNTGTGLGLAIVHRIIDAHGGGIAVSNDPVHGGAVFELTLPQPADSPAEDARELEHALAHAAAAAAPPHVADGVHG